MESLQFVEWFQEIIKETKDTDGPKLLIFDGHNSHISKTVVDLTVDNQIELLCLPAHTSSILQPLDVGRIQGSESSLEKMSHYIL